MSTTTAPFSLEEIGHQIREGSDRYGVLDEQSLAALDTPGQCKAEAELQWALSELMAWHQLALTRLPRSLADASVQVAELFELVARINHSDIASQLRTGTLEEDLKTVERVLAGLAVVVAAVARVDLLQVCEGGILDRLARHAPLCSCGERGFS